MKLRKIPFLRGIVALIESAGVGSRHLTFSTDRFDVEPGEEKEEEEQETSKLTMVIGVAAVGVLSFFSVNLFLHLFQFFGRIIHFNCTWENCTNITRKFFKLILLT